MRWLFPFLLLLGNMAYAESVIATRLIRPREVLTADTLALHDFTRPIGFASIDEIIGLEARRAIYPGRPITSDDIGPPAVIERNAIVPLLFRQHGLTILTEGRALSRAASGEVLRVMNLSSRQTIFGTAMADGTVLISNERTSP